MVGANEKKKQGMIDNFIRFVGWANGKEIW